MAGLKINYNGKIVYAITSYLTAELSAKAPESKPDDGFTAATGKVTAKDETNLRAEPSTDGKLIATIKNGEFAEKTVKAPRAGQGFYIMGKRFTPKQACLQPRLKSLRRAVKRRARQMNLLLQQAE